MADPLLNSVHLEAPRRDLFRQAREGLLASRGNQTVCLESAVADAVCIAIGTVPSKEQPSVCLLTAANRRQLLKVGVNTLGRLPDNDVVVPDAHVSRRHCAIVVHSSQLCEVHDVASKNGTFLNGAKIAGPTCLKPGDEIKIGDSRVVFWPSHAVAASVSSAGEHTQAL